MDHSSPGSSVYGDSPGENTEVSCHVLLQGIIVMYCLNLCLLGLLHWQADSLSLASPGNPTIKCKTALSFLDCSEEGERFPLSLGSEFSL